MSKKIEKSIKLGGRELTLSTGHLAAQASGAVMARYGETVCLATVVASELDRDLDYFPLTIEYQEKLYAGGRIKGSRWIKRSGRPTDDEILTARLIDRSLRPLFPKTYKKDVQIIITILSIDEDNSPDVVAGIAAAATVSISPIPWKGPISMLRVGLLDKEFVVNPTNSELETSEMDLVVSSTKDSVVMIEAGSNQIAEKDILKGIGKVQKEGEKVVSLIESLSKEVGVKKEAVEKKKVSKTLENKVKKLADDDITDLIGKMAIKKAGYSDYDQVKKAVADSFEDEEDKKASREIFDDLFKNEIRGMILKGKRPDGRKSDDLRDLSSEISVLPRTHGSAIFQRGQTQALSIATLGAPSLELFIETPTGEETKRYIHLYTMPPFSTGETGRVYYPSRREIGHGALAERALLPVLPSEEEFPYTIQVVTEILSSNGSTSMASVCGSSLSLMDAGVPIKSGVAGIAMGLVIESTKKYKVLTDIVGMEDGSGDMDFKVAGSKDGITALQLDVKTLNLTLPILEEALSQAKDARLKILDVMEKAIGSPKKSVSKYAPKIKTIKIPTDKIGGLIGPGGKTIKKIIAETGAQVDVDDDGTVFISGETEESLSEGIKRVEALTKDPTPGEIYEGEVKKLLSFGAFVEILPGKEGLVHVSDMSMDFVKDPADLLSEGDNVKVKVKGIDDMGRLNLTMILKGEKPKKERRNDRRDQGKGRDQRRNYSKGRRGKSSYKKSSGPHFPTSRLMDNDKKRF